MSLQKGLGDNGLNLGRPAQILKSVSRGKACASRHDVALAHCTEQNGEPKDLPSGKRLWGAVPETGLLLASCNPLVIHLELGTVERTGLRIWYIREKAL